MLWRFSIYCCIGYAKYKIQIQGPSNTFFVVNAIKKLLNIFSNFFFYLKVQSFRLIIENNSFQMAASVGHAVAYTIDSIFKHIIDSVQLHGFTNIVLWSVNCLWFVGVTLIFDGTPQIIVQRCQIAAHWLQRPLLAHFRKKMA